MTRQWSVDAKILCDEHLQREHWELHQLVDVVRGEWDIDDYTAAMKIFGHAARAQVDLSSVQDRHDELASEMKLRGIGHDSPMAFKAPFAAGNTTDQVRKHNRDELARRCIKCANKQGATA